MRKWQRLLATMVVLIMLIATSGFSGFADETVPSDTGTSVETVVEAPAAEETAVEPAAEEPVEEEPVEEEPVEEEPVEEESVEEEPVEEEPVEEEPVEEEPVEEEPAEEEPVEEEPVEEEPVEEESAEEEPVEEEPVEEEPAEEEPVEEEPVEEEPAEEIVGILKVTCEGGVAGEETIIKISAIPEVTVLKMIIEDDEVIWKERNALKAEEITDDEEGKAKAEAASIIIEDDGDSKLWEIKHVFECAGSYELVYQGSVDGETWSKEYVVKGIEIAESEVEEPVEEELETEEPTEDESETDESVQDDIILAEDTLETYNAKSSAEVELAAADDIDILYVYCGNGIAKKPITIRVDAETAITSVKMNIGDEQVIWNEGDEGVEIADCGNYREWQIVHTFEWAGTYNLSYQGSADGATWGDKYWADTVSMKDADVLYVYCGNGIAKKPVTIRVDTNATITSVKMNIGDQEVIWNEGDEGVTVESYDTYKTWQVVHTFEWAGDYGLSYQGSADGTTWGEKYWADTVSMKDADVLYVYSEGGSAEKAITMRVDTNATITSLKMNIGDAEVIWNEGDEGVTVESYDTYKTWYVKHTFEWAGEYGLSYQGSADGTTWGEEYWADPIVITEAKDCSVESVSVEGDTAGEALTFTVVTGLDAAYLYAVIDSDMTLTWSVEDGDVTVADDEENRTWIVSYTFEEAGEYDLVFSASDNGVDMSNNYEITVTVVQESATYEGFGYATNDAGTGIIITSYEYNGTQANVIVPNTINDLPVVEIGSEVFMGNTVMTSVSLPDTVQVIGTRAFANCTALSSMTCTAP